MSNQKKSKRLIKKATKKEQQDLVNFHYSCEQVKQMKKANDYMRSFWLNKTQTRLKLKSKREEFNMSNLVKIIQDTLVENKNNSSEVEQASTNSSSTTLNYQFMYKQLESAVEEIIIQYPNDPIVNELKQKLLNNLKPILEVIQNNPNQDFDQ